MINKKLLLLRTLIASILISAIATLVAYIWTDGSEGFSSIVVWFVAIVSFLSAVILALFMQIIFIKLDKKKANTISGIIVFSLISLGLWGYNF